MSNNDGLKVELNQQKYRLLDLFCGAGGCSMGYYRAGFEVVGVDNSPQKHYPFEFHQADAFEFLEDNGYGFDVVHASPPCQAYTRTNAAHRWKHPRLIEKTRKCLIESKKPFVIENVPDARKFLKSAIMLCGGMFSLPIHRHRYFECNPEIFELLPPCEVRQKTVYITGTPRPSDGSPRKDATAEEKRAAMKTYWMTTKEMDEAIPPAYTEWIGKQILKYLKQNQKWIETEEF